VKLSDDKVSHLTHVLLKGLIDESAITIVSDEGDVRREIRRIITKELKIAADIDEAVRRKLSSYSKKIPEGSSEWDLMYQKFFNEESSKKGRG
jgi:hypothetical protein